MKHILAQKLIAIKKERLLTGVLFLFVLALTFSLLLSSRLYSLSIPMLWLDSNFLSIISFTINTIKPTITKIYATNKGVEDSDTVRIRKIPIAKISKLYTNVITVRVLFFNFNFQLHKSGKYITIVIVYTLIFKNLDLIRRTHYSLNTNASEVSISRLSYTRFNFNQIRCFQ